MILRVFSQVLDKDFVLPIGKAKIQRPGKDVTLVGLSLCRTMSYNIALLLRSTGI